MIGRRSFLLSTATITIAQLLSSCANSPQDFTVSLLQGSIPLQLIGDFRKKIDNKNQVKFKPQAHLSELFKLLSDPSLAQSQANFFQKILGLFRQKTPQNPDLLTLGDYWLESAINQKLLQPLNSNQLENWDKLPLLWQKLVQRDNKGKSSEQGQIYGAPYRWGNTIIVYRKDKFQSLNWRPQDWDDLWREELRDRISLVDSYREVIGLTLKSLGHSYNSENLNSIPNLETKLIQLNQQVKFYSSDKYLQSLIIGDIWLAVGWSSDILPLMKRYSNLGVVVPKSGTSLWADLWIQPKSTAQMADNSTLSAWIDFCWQPKAAKQISLFTSGISPIWTQEKSIDLGKNTQNKDFINKTLDTLSQSEFISPLNPDITQEYLSLWQKIRVTI
ncbi:MAG: extracellular solute-binding protein [Xenococcaceae cyanobacterium MO_188.B19]|nr:extracellular solute-binding protein [Xenococcaceae cyanobacterium MO_188.B19]